MCICKQHGGWDRAGEHKCKCLGDFGTPDKRLRSYAAMQRAGGFIHRCYNGRRLNIILCRSGRLAVLMKPRSRHCLGNVVADSHQTPWRFGFTIHGGF
jgi:hypothetical protein